jgi:hypothetical protein
VRAINCAASKSAAEDCPLSCGQICGRGWKSSEVRRHRLAMSASTKPLEHLRTPDILLGPPKVGLSSWALRLPNKTPRGSDILPTTINSTTARGCYCLAGCPPRVYGTWLRFSRDDKAARTLLGISRNHSGQQRPKEPEYQLTAAAARVCRTSQECPRVFYTLVTTPRGLHYTTPPDGVAECSKVRRRAKSVSNAIRAPKNVQTIPKAP